MGFTVWAIWAANAVIKMSSNPTFDGGFVSWAKPKCLYFVMSALKIDHHKNQKNFNFGFKVYFFGSN